MPTPQKYRIGEPVWARLDGFPWWPARVVKPQELWLGANETPPKPGPSELLVEFFNDEKRFACLSAAKLRPFPNRKPPASASLTLLDAVDECQQYITDIRWRLPTDVGNVFHPTQPSSSDQLPHQHEDDQNSIIIRSPQHIEDHSQQTPAPLAPPSATRTKRTKQTPVGRRGRGRGRAPTRARKAKLGQQQSPPVSPPRKRMKETPSKPREDASPIEETAHIIQPEPPPQETPTSPVAHAHSVPENAPEQNSSSIPVVLDLVTEDSKAERSVQDNPEPCVAAGSERGRMSGRPTGSPVFAPHVQTGPPPDYARENDIIQAPPQSETGREGNVYQILSKDQVISLLVARERENRVYYHQNQLLRRRLAAIESGELSRTADELLIMSKPVFEAVGAFLDRIGNGRMDAPGCTHGSASRTQDGLT